ncbi:MAG: hypothetical protein DRI48_00875 [Chloroflexi bacterium]|nr:MAG: hypothetical protein DRI48_00875 [Chloroflexota bacterium]
MSTRFKPKALVVSLALLVGLLGNCGPTPEPPRVSGIDVKPSTTIMVGETASLTTKASGTDLQFKWTVARGNLSGSTTPSVIYTAPDSPGPDTVTVEVTGKGGTTVQSITFEVIPPPTEPSTPIPTLTPTETPTPTPTPTPTITPTPVPPLVEIFPQAEGGEAFVFKNEGGELNTRYVESTECRHSGMFGLRLIYAMSGEGNGGWGIHWVNTSTGYFDASGFSEFVLWVKGTSGGETFQIGLKDTSGREAKVESESLVIVSSSDWRQVRALLSKFTGVNTASIENVNIGFNPDHGSGTICIDDIAFE